MHQSPQFTSLELKRSSLCTFFSGPLLLLEFRRVWGVILVALSKFPTSKTKSEKISGVQPGRMERRH